MPKEFEPIPVTTEPGVIAYAPVRAKRAWWPRWRRRIGWLAVLLIAAGLYWARGPILWQATTRHSIWQAYVAQENCLTASAADGEIVLRTDGRTTELAHACAVPPAKPNVLGPVKPMLRVPPAWTQFVAAHGALRWHNSVNLPRLHPLMTPCALVDFQQRVTPKGVTLAAWVTVEMTGEQFTISTAVMTPGGRFAPPEGIVRPRDGDAETLSFGFEPLDGPVVVRRVAGAQPGDLRLQFEQGGRTSMVDVRWAGDHFALALEDAWTDPFDLPRPDPPTPDRLAAGRVVRLPDKFAAPRVIHADATHVILEHEWFEDRRPRRGMYRVDRATGTVTDLPRYDGPLPAAERFTIQRKGDAPLITDTRTGVALPELKVPSVYFGSRPTAVSPDGRFVVGGQSSGCVVNATNGDVVTALPLLTYTEEDVTFSADSRWLAVGGRLAYVVDLADVDAPRFYVPPGLRAGEQYTVRLTPDGRGVVVVWARHVAWYALPAGEP